MAQVKSKTKSKMLTIKVTADQLRLIEQRAEKCGVKKGPWARSIVLQAARSAAAQGYLRIREPDGVIT